MLSFVFEGRVVLIVMFVQNVCKVQEHLVVIYDLVDQNSSGYFVNCLFVFLFC